MQFSDEQFNKVRAKAEQDYKAVGKIRCPYFNEDISFNSEGLSHILFKSWNTARSRDDQYVRLRLLPLAVRVIKTSHTLQEYFETKRFERIRSNGNWQKQLKRVRYYGFVAIINNALIKVIIREVEGGQKHFYSLIPRWRFEENNGNKKRVLHRGNPEED
ncbi:hypothetical protein KGQ24_00280 [Patescibacteria group bacterium]|nr:hypothetical protein [Patescibacteria group bacterium]